MPFSWPFTRKKLNTRTPAEIANQKALSEVQKKYGRMGRHSKVANVLRPNEGYHDPFEIERKQLAKTFLEEGQKEAEKITKGQKQKIIDWASELKEKLNTAKKFNQRGGENKYSITMDIPIFIGKALLFIIGLGLLACGIVAVFAEIAFVISGGGGGTGVIGPGLSLLLVSQSLSMMSMPNFMRPYTNNKPNIVVVNNPMNKVSEVITRNPILGRGFPNSTTRRINRYA